MDQGLATGSTTPEIQAMQWAALANAVSTGKISSFENVIVYYGDILSRINLTEMIQVHRSVKAGATLVLSQGYTLPVGVATVNNGLVTSLIEKPTYDISVTTGNMVVSKKAIPTLVRMTKKEASHLGMMKNFIPVLLEEDGTRVASYYVKDFWYGVCRHGREVFGPWGTRLSKNIQAFLVINQRFLIGAYMEERIEFFGGRGRTG